MNSLEQLLEFLYRLDAFGISYKVECTSLPPREALMVVFRTPGKYFEVDFFPDGHIEVEKYESVEGVDSMTLDEVTELVRDHWVDQDGPTTPSGTN